MYISQSTEVGTVYAKAELKALHEVCRENNLLLYADGARLGVALTAEGCDVTLADMAQYCDFFCIGGTKNGALFGEALVLVNPCLKPDFLYIVKQRGGLFAKGRLLGIQFAELFRDGLYYELARHANGEAMRIKAALTELGLGPAGEDVHVQLRGGELIIRVLPDKKLLMTGSAVTVCEGIAEV